MRGAFDAQAPPAKHAGRLLLFRQHRQDRGARQRHAPGREARVRAGMTTRRLGQPHPRDLRRADRARHGAASTAGTNDSAGAAGRARRDRGVAARSRLRAQLGVAADVPQHHRGVTHSLLMLPLWSIVLAWLCAMLWRNGPGWRAYFGVFAWGIGIHIAGDWITSFGTLLLAPFSVRRFALSTTFIIDLWLLRSSSRAPSRASCGAAPARPPSPHCAASQRASRSRAGSTTRPSRSAEHTRRSRASPTRRSAPCRDRHRRTTGWWSWRQAIASTTRKCASRRPRAAGAPWHRLHRPPRRALRASSAGTMDSRGPLRDARADAARA